MQKDEENAWFVIRKIRSHLNASWASKEEEDSEGCSSEKRGLNMVPEMSLVSIAASDRDKGWTLLILAARDSRFRAGREGRSGPFHLTSNQKIAKTVVFTFSPFKCVTMNILPRIESNSPATNAKKPYAPDRNVHRSWLESKDCNSEIPMRREEGHILI